jgi:hypothetical protein
MGVRVPSLVYVVALQRHAPQTKAVESPSDNKINKNQLRLGRTGGCSKP